MWRSNKFIVFALLIAVVLAGGAVGIVLAQTGNGDESQPETLLSRVAVILGIEQQPLEDAFAQARSEMLEEALDSRLQYLVDQGTMTQEQADEYKTWWQARPDTPLPGRFGLHGFRGGMKWGRGSHFRG